MKIMCAEKIESGQRVYCNAELGADLELLSKSIDGEPGTFSFDSGVIPISSIEVCRSCNEETIIHPSKWVAYEGLKSQWEEKKKCLVK